MQRLRNAGNTLVLHLGDSPGTPPWRPPSYGTVLFTVRVVRIALVPQVDAFSGTISGCSALWSLSAVPNTNLYIVAVTEAPCLVRAKALLVAKRRLVTRRVCTQYSNVCQCDANNYVYPATSSCQCPGAASLSYDTCTGVFNEVGSELSDPTCPPPPVTRDLQLNEQQASTAGLSKCYVVGCDAATTCVRSHAVACSSRCVCSHYVAACACVCGRFLDCYGRLGCDFCQVRFGRKSVECFPPVPYPCLCVLV